MRQTQIKTFLRDFRPSIHSLCNWHFQAPER